MKTILCPVDFSQGSDRALKHAVEFARALDAEIHLLHVFQMPIYSVPVGVAYAGEASALLDQAAQIREQLQEQLSKLKGRVADEKLKVQAHLAEGLPYRSIVDSAKELEADMIVMGTHGRTGLSHLVVGSVAERVVRLADIPVLTVPLDRAAA